MQMDTGAEALLDRRQQILIPLDLQIRVQAALHQDAGSAQVECFLNLVEDDLVREDVALGVAHGAIEGAEAAVLGAEIGVVDVAVDDVADHAFRMELAPDGVGLHADTDEVIGCEQFYSFLFRDHTTSSPRADAWAANASRA